MKQIAESIKDRFFKLGVDVPLEDIENRLSELITKFKVPENEAQRSVVNYFLKKYSIPKNEYYARQAEARLCKLSDLSEAGQWTDVKVKVIQLWDKTHESIAQVGLIGDETGVIKFTKWLNAGLPELEQGKSYLLKGVLISEYNGRLSIELKSNSSIEKLEEEVEVGGGEFTSEEMESELRDIEELTQANQWVSIRGKIVQLWENTHESIEQVGLIGDETGVIRFTNWTSSELPAMEEGKCYLLSNVIVKEWNGRYSIQLNKASSIEILEEDIEVGTATSSYFGAMVDIQTGSGLIKRCPECKRALIKGACAEHGKIKGEYDLRIKAVLDNGTSTQEALINRELTQKSVGLSLDEAIAMAAEALDPGVVLDRLKQKLIGRYYNVSGPRVERYILVDSFVESSEMDKNLLETMIAELEVE
ncbi:MAG: replication protein A [Methanosarcinaceae archaeon]|nr:replication protein A [Methanosarcinaceae archaeon]MDD4749926.1 replication protein A [Methanosarcinaceae archaeon]